MSLTNQNGKLRTLQEIRGYSRRKRSEKAKLILLNRVSYDLIEEKVKELNKHGSDITTDEYMEHVLELGPKFAHKSGVLNTIGWRKGYTK